MSSLQTIKRFDLAILLVAVAVITGGAGFALGHAGAPKTTAAPGQSATGNSPSGFGGGGGRRFGGRPTFGTVSSLSGTILTITDTSGTAHAVTLTADTTYTNGDRTAATQADLKAGTSVAAIGQAGSDGAITATRILINPQMPSGGGGSSGAPAN
ncbi:MAG: hypothetical protein JWN01_134 [Patescibacteria group bacterium]|nr:hypothetical protein [Patescibacteria group bacterium]